MKLQFDAHQDYQLAAIRAVVALFEGQPDASQTALTRDDALSSLALTEAGIANRRVIDEAQWLANLRAVQKAHGIEPSEALATMALEDGSPVGGFPNFTVEMETGTGKTYVYLRTIHELAKTYGFKKFVIVVPSVAIREGVLSSLKLTREHFQTLYDYERVEFMVYDSGKVNQLRNFALSDAIQILVINIDAFAKDSTEASDGPGGGKAKKKAKGNVINQVRETGVKPIEFIQATQPIVILDEPQNLETDIRKQAIARLNPLCTLRYSATHRNAYNLIYSLDPVRAYELGLVKQIGVDSVIELKDANQAFIEVEGFKTGKRSVSAKLTIWVNQAGGPAKKSVTVKNGDDLYALSNQREIYRNGFIVNEIDAGEGFVVFANDVRVAVGRPHGALADAILRLQIEATVRRHFEKAKKLHPMGIKVLSVFFIDRVANYRVYAEDGTTAKGKFAQWFEEIYARYQAMEEFAGVMKADAAAVHNGYFAQDKRAVSPFETLTGKTHADAEGAAFELIMRDKERLLDLNEPLAFIFSHSALREGWDNPNVFQICTLAESSSEIKKRQEIGRGLRLAVNQNGERVRDPAINRLTVIANESYEDFAKQLQTEMVEAGVRFTPEMLKNERDKVTLRLKQGYDTDSRFLDLWEKIRARTRYRVNYSTAELVTKAASRIRDKMPAIERPKVALTRADIAIDSGGVTGTQTGFRTLTVEAKYVMPDLVGQVQAKTGLAKSTVARILMASGRLAEALNNPQVFIDYAAELINAVKREFLVYGDGSEGSGVKYVKLENAYYEMRRFEDDLKEEFASNVRAVQKQEKTLFSHIVIDSNSGPERAFAQACEDNEDVLFYIKLPRWFRIDTPVGSYNPDWAVAYRNDTTLYFVAETKRTGNGDHVQLDLLRPIEDLRIECGKRHFKNFEAVRFKVVSTLDELVG
ncbi:restriction endonuclease [Zoogloeaceae bacteirum Par-f-2]|jgi:type III restriction enzyme|nr:restriction endonuclease [Rhodocyclaceae bacterium]AVZ79202.1 restriction endonuclease [Zoogloeaceae bacteirum Par-f-2]